MQRNHKILGENNVYSILSVLYLYNYRLLITQVLNIDHYWEILSTTDRAQIIEYISGTLQNYLDNC